MSITDLNDSVTISRGVHLSGVKCDLEDLATFACCKWFFRCHGKSHIRFQAVKDWKDLKFIAIIILSNKFFPIKTAEEIWAPRHGKYVSSMKDNLGTQILHFNNVGKVVSITKGNQK